MVRKVCLDSDVIIDYLSDGNMKSVMLSLDAEFYTTSISVFETWYGKRKQEPLPELFNWINIYGFGKDEALLAAEILLELRTKGEVIDFKDVFIASICITNDFELLTGNLKHFSRIKKFGLKLVKI